MNFSVVIPVGPRESDQRYLSDCLESVINQTYAPCAIVLVDDMAGLRYSDFARKAANINIYRAPWRLGVAHAFNFGVALAPTDFVFLVGADDILRPAACEQAMRTAERNNYSDGYYWFPVEYSDGRTQALPCGAALVTKRLWVETGGFPMETATGASDAALVSILLAHRPQALVRATDAPLYWYRVHDETDTARRAAWQGVIVETRNLVTREWSSPDWMGLRNAHS